VSDADELAEQRGLLTRRRFTDDARAKLLHLAEHGQNAVRAARAHRAALDAELAAECEAERFTQTRDLLAALLIRFDADDSIRSRRVRPRP
jgi:DNA-binding MarR family transcriptional regulator